ncbi:hypothetical protein PENTCL1PPCAC_4090, partial [Pristionchus entomophagus]
QMGRRAKRIEAFHKLKEITDAALEDTVENPKNCEGIFKVCFRAIKIHYLDLSLFYLDLSLDVFFQTIDFVESGEILLPFIFDELQKAHAMGGSNEEKKLEWELSVFLHLLYDAASAAYRDVINVSYHTQLTKALLAMHPASFVPLVEHPAFYSIIATLLIQFFRIGTSVQHSVPGVYR